MELPVVEVFSKVAMFGLYWWKNLREVCRTFYEIIPDKEGMLKELGISLRDSVTWEHANSYFIESIVLVEISPKRKFKGISYQEDSKAQSIFFFGGTEGVSSAIIIFAHLTILAAFAREYAHITRISFEVREKGRSHFHTNFTAWPAGCRDNCPMRKHLNSNPKESFFLTPKSMLLESFYDVIEYFYPREFASRYHLPGKATMVCPSGHRAPCPWAEQIRWNCALCHTECRLTGGIIIKSGGNLNSRRILHLGKKK